MNIKDQVCSVDLSKKLHELNFNKESYFAYFFISHDDSWEVRQQTKSIIGLPTYTVSELGLFLPNNHKSFRIDNGWWMDVINPIEKWNNMYPCNTEADARAKMLIYLLEKQFIETQVC